MGKKSKKSAKKQKSGNGVAGVSLVIPLLIICAALAAIRGSGEQTAGVPYPQSELDFLDFFASLEEGPSAVHGTGVFFNGKCAAGMEKGSRLRSSNNEILAACAATPSKTNSPLMPPWKELLLGSHAAAATAIHNDQLDAGHEEVLAAFRQSWLDCIDSECSNADMLDLEHEFDMNSMQITSALLEFTVDLMKGQEMLRACGHEWIAVEFFQLKAACIQFLALAVKGAIQSCIVFDEELNAPGAVKVDDNVPRSKEDVTVAALSDLAAWADSLECLAQTVGAGDAIFLATWSLNLARLQKEFGCTPEKDT